MWLRVASLWSPSAYCKVIVIELSSWLTPTTNMNVQHDIHKLKKKRQRNGPYFKHTTNPPFMNIQLNPTPDTPSNASRSNNGTALNFADRGSFPHSLNLFLFVSLLVFTYVSSTNSFLPQRRESGSSHPMRVQICFRQSRVIMN